MKKILSLFAVVLSCAVLMTGTASAQGAPNQSTPRSYAALGDSVAAGLGLPGKTHPVGNDTLCGRSTQSYAYIVAARMDLRLNHMACSGATVGDLFTKQGVDGPNIDSQLSTAFTNGTPGLITITAGANDAHWDNFIRGCFATDCASESANLVANSYLLILQAKLHVAFSSIYLRSGGSPPAVVITGYYSPLSPTCARLQSQVTAEEITWINAQTRAISQTIRDVANQYSFVRFAPVSFMGHRLCSENPWIQGVADPAPFHPNAAGQKVIANSVLKALGQ